MGDVVTLIVLICLTRRQLKQHGFNNKMQNASILYQAISVLVLCCIELLGVWAQFQLQSGALRIVQPGDDLATRSAELKPEAEMTIEMFTVC